MSVAPNAPHRDAADWQVLVLELRAECCSDRLIAEEVGVTYRVVENWRRGRNAVPAPASRRELLRMAFEELSPEALIRARITTTGAQAA